MAMAMFTRGYVLVFNHTQGMIEMTIEFLGWLQTTNHIPTGEASRAIPPACR